MFHQAPTMQLTINVQHEIHFVDRNGQLTPNSKKTEAVTFTVTTGDRLKELYHQLLSNLIRNSSVPGLRQNLHLKVSGKIHDIAINPFETDSISAFKKFINTLPTKKPAPIIEQRPANIPLGVWLRM